MRKLDKPLYEDLGKQLKRARLEKGYSLEDVAKMVGKSKVSIKRYEDANVRIDMDTLNCICRALSLTPVIMSRQMDGLDIEEPKVYLAPSAGTISPGFPTDGEVKSFTRYLQDLSDRMFDDFMHLDISSQKIILMTLKFTDEEIEDIIKTIH